MTKGFEIELFDEYLKRMNRENVFCKVPLIQIIHANIHNILRWLRFIILNNKLFRFLCLCYTCTHLILRIYRVDIHLQKNILVRRRDVRVHNYA